MHPREKLSKLKLTPDIEESANRILNKYLHGNENIPEITDNVYVMEKVIGIKSGTVQKKINFYRKKRHLNGNRRGKVEG